MSAKLTPQQIDDILSAIDIVEVINQYVALKPAGKNFKGICPFHTEKTPSFMVSPDKGLWHCFGCGEGGNTFQFLMKMENISFIEAAKTLAAQAGISLVISEEEKKIWSEKEKLLKLMEIASKFYQNCLFLKIGENSLSYLKKRGLDNETIKKFSFGYAPMAYDGLFKFLESRKVPPSLMIKAGLIKARQDGNFYDYFRDRLIIPIFNSKGNVVAFGARGLSKDAVPKYINSPETPLFKKGSELYCLNFSKSQIIRDNHAVVVEGYFDAAVCYKEGIKKVVASMGTALTQFQANLLARFSHRVTLALDGDTAGQAATLRSLAIFEVSGLDVDIFVLPPSDDPDSFIRKKGLEEFQRRLKNAENIYDYRIKCASQKFNLEKAEGKTGFIKELLPVVLGIKEIIKRDQYIKKIAELSEVKEELIRHLIKNNKILHDKERMGVFFSPSTGQEKLLQIVVNFPEKIKILKEKLPVEFLNGLKFEKIFNLIYSLNDRELASKKGITSRILEEIEGDKIKDEFLKNVLQPQEDYSDEFFEGLIKNVKDFSLKRRFSQLKKEMEEKLAGSKVSHKDNIFKEYQELARYFKGSALEERLER